MGAVASQITSLTIAYSTVYSGADQIKHQSSASLALVRGIHRWPVNLAQMASNAENVSSWWRHHDGMKDIIHTAMSVCTNEDSEDVAYLQMTLLLFDTIQLPW